MPMGIIAINNTVPRKLKISSLSVKNEKECFPSSEYQSASAITIEITVSKIGKIRQQYLFFSITLCFFGIKIKSTFYLTAIINDLVSELHVEKYPRAPFEIFEFGFAGAAEPGLLFTTSPKVLKYS